MRIRLSLLSCLGLALGFAQTPPPENFDSLARGAQASVENNPERAIALARRGLELRPNWAEGWFYLGGALYHLKHYSEALDAFHKGVALAPDNSVAWALMGLCEHQTGQQNEALADIVKAEKLGLGALDLETAVRQQAASILISESLFDKAIGQLQPLAQYHVNNPAVISLIGLCALTDARQPGELPAARRPVVALAGKALWGAISHAPPKDNEENFKQLIASYPDEPGVHYAYGLFLQNTAEPDTALAEFQKEIAAHPGHWPSLLGSAFLEVRQGTPELALKSAEQAAKFAPPSYRWLCEAEMGRALLELDQPEKAVTAFEEAVKLQKENPRTHFYLAKAYRRVGRKKDAEKENAEFMRLGGQQEPATFLGFADSTPTAPPK